MPTLSVIMGVFYPSNETSSLEQAVTSILRQSFSDFEFLICDDGSSMKAQSFLSQISAEDHRVRLLRPGELLTLPQKLNHCLKNARGTWIARMDDDDSSHKTRLEKQLAFLNGHPDTAFAGCNVNEILAGRVVGHRYLPEYPAPKDFRFAMPFVHPTLVFRRDILEQVNGYSEDPRCIQCEDYDLLLRLYEHGHHGANLQEFLFDYSVQGVVSGRRTYEGRVNEAVTRYRRFRALHMLPGAFPYVIKPLAVGLLPLPVLNALRAHKRQREESRYVG